ncbi:hypothetical protein ACC718_26970 [Rhizobium ruizarguesonis]|uniref:hypothetical protein n=1 Tax=Rhizobium ruizarguesonis TaxID=2081791 RepID=UPI001FEEA749|nr:hypothetical protein [Rhizobium ruizarguesonis]
MPVRRRAGKRRSTDGLDQWFFVFSSGHDFFDELAISESRRMPTTVHRWRMLNQLGGDWVTPF